jgi:succinate dehydrogenase / fumarate reductase flavoprotein subunit
MEPEWRRTLLVCRAGGGDPVVPDVRVTREPQIPVREDLLQLFEMSELEKYFTDGELAQHAGRSK